MTDFQITGFEIREKLGEGGMASVWKARQISLDRIVAIKILADHFTSDPEDIEMFHKEAQQAAKLKHPGIVQVYDANAENGIYYFVMEYVAGYTVGDWVRRKGCLSEKDCLLVAECVSDALEYAWNHSRIIHCDIKPDNVMVDDDGTVKVTDLGLARTISAMSEDDESEEIMGTPAYISPEQAMGRADLDYHSDIYSLGAMLYHLSTGRLMFEESPEDKVMELQVTSFVVDPLDVNPSLSKPFCWFLEKMLAKNPAERPATWEEVRKDIDRVKKRMMPIGCLADGHVSTIQRSRSRTKQDMKRIHAVEENPGSPIVKILIAVAVVFVLGVGVFVLSDRGGNQSPESSSQSYSTSVSEESVVQKQRESQAKEMYDFAVTWVNDHPSRYAESIDRFSAVASQTKGTKYALMAIDQINKLKVLWLNEQKKVMAKLEDEAGYYINNNELKYAAALYAKYSGPFAKDTETQRLEISEELLARDKRVQDEKAQNKQHLIQKYEDVLDGIVSSLVNNGVGPALELLEKSIYDVDLKEHREAFLSLKQCLVDASKIDEKILASFNNQRGQNIVVELTSGKKQLTIDGVKDGKVQARQQYSGSRAMIAVPFEVGQLSVKERLLRMGDDSQADVALVKGLMAVKSGSDTYASVFFAKTHPLISDRLLALIKGAGAEQTEDGAREALITGLKDIGVNVGPDFDAWVWGAAVEEISLTEAEVERAVNLVESFRSKYGASKFCKQAEPVLASLIKKEVRADGSAKAATPDASFSGSRMQGMSGDKAVVNNGAPISADAIIAALLKENSGVISDQIEVLNDSDGNVYRINIYSEGIENLSAIAMCKSLRHLYCSVAAPEAGYSGETKAPLSDLSPLKGLPLEKLYLASTSVKDISALSGMKLENLDLRHTKVADISVLKYMNLKYLNLENTMVKDISDISRMSLEELNLGGTKVFDFKPIIRKPIRMLALNDTQFKDMFLLNGMPLVGLDLANTNVRDLKGIQAFKLKSLSLSGIKINDLNILTGMPLEILKLERVKAGDYKALSSFACKRLYLRESNIQSIESIDGSRLELLDISGTSVIDIEPVRKMPALGYLLIANTGIRDFRALAGSRVSMMDCRGFSATDLIPLAKVMHGLQEIIVDDPTDYEVRRVIVRMPGLRRINWEPISAWQ